MSNHGEIRVGPAGWNYKDWYGIVYPENTDKNFKELDYIAGLFNTAEINSTFYRPANVHMAKAWVYKVAHNPNFKFTAKLWQRFTHEREPYTCEETDLVRQGMDPLVEAGLMGALLIQFPWSFKNTAENLGWLTSVTDSFKEYPLVVELRHKTWDRPDTFDLLNRLNVGFASIDQPVIGQSIEFKPICTGSVGYVRMHGRNYSDWFQKKDEKQPGSTRYDYLYTEQEIRLITDTVRTVSQGAKETYVIQNNHPRGQAVANSMQIRADLGETILNLPETLLKHFPELKRLQRPA